jgi:hypothetical protein
LAMKESSVFRRYVSHIGRSMERNVALPARFITGW